MTEEIQMILTETEDSMKASIDHLNNELSKVRAGRATPSMLEGVLVDYYGSPTPLSQVGNVTTLDARTLTVQPWEKAMLNEIAKGIMNANLGLNPQNNGEIIIIAIPVLTEERRKDLVKKAKGEGEHAKVSIRSKRKDAIDFLRTMKNDGVSEDIIKDSEEKVQKLTDKYNVKVDELIAAKEIDILKV
jgi:ribosome recycling factor